MKEKRKKIGLPPGSIIFTGNQKEERVGIHYLLYNASHFEEHIFDNQKKIAFRQSSPDIVDWYDFRGLHDTKLIEALGAAFDVHALTLEDIVDISQRPKFEEYDKGIFIIIRALRFEKNSQEIKAEQVAIYFRKGLVLSFQETASDLFETVRQRIHSGKGRIRERGADYLAYALLDVIVDHYFFVLDEVEQLIEKLEEDLLKSTDTSIRERIHHVKKELLFARKNIAPLRESVNKFSKIESDFVDNRLSVFLRDLYDHIIGIIDTVESYRDILNGLQDLHLSEISFKMNQIMQVLTIITTIFVPLSFLAGLYGMNFDNIPELHYKYGYFILLAIMVSIAGGLLLWFKNKKWL